jgi:hypothetical protein
MTRDPFYQQIVERLCGTLDEELFERCAADLLRRIYPTLVPIRGGNDGGMDGACADGQGPAFPLITTTGEDVIGNLRGSLNSYRLNGGTRNLAISATSQKLTPVRRRNLEEAANSFGVTLINVHDQSAFADLLYRSPEWCRELLNLVGDPPLLSALPLTCRPQLDLALIGRDEDLTWLTDTPGDLLVIGQPGAGKTFLLTQLARSDGGLFVRSRDLTQIANALRSQQPNALLIDDAHASGNLIEQLRHLRLELGADFRIIADCWPGAEDVVATQLGISSRAVRRLPRLPRGRILDIIRACGIRGPNDLLHELVRQANGRPGLAVTLCQLCLQEDSTRPVALADALCRDTRVFFEQLVGRQAITVLSCFAVGGIAGMELSQVAEFLRLPIAEVHSIATQLASGGVVEDAGNNRLLVQPEPLRHALVRDTFFNGPARLPIAGLLDLAGETATQTVIGACHRGANVDNHLLTARMSTALQDRTWLEFAFLGDWACRWALQNRPTSLAAIAPAALQWIPRIAIPLLLDQYARDGQKVLRVIADWIASAAPGSDQVVFRRHALLDSILEWTDSSNHPNVAIAAFALALSPGFEYHESNPADRRSFRICRGVVLPDECTRIQQFWPRVRDRLCGIPVVAWKPIMDMIRGWAWPYNLGGSPDAEHRRMLIEFAMQMLRDCAGIAQHHCGFVRWARRIAQLHNTELDVVISEEFLTLFPIQDGILDPAELDRQQTAIRELSERWSLEQPNDVARRIVSFETSLHEIEEDRWPQWTPALCDQIAQQAADPIAWLTALQEAGARVELFAPFLRRVVVRGDPGWQECLSNALNDSVLRPCAVALILTMPNPTAELSERAWASLAGLGELVRSLVHNHCLSVDAVRRFLRHDDSKIAASAAFAIWYATVEHVVPPELYADWRRIIVADGSDVTSDMVRADPDLPFEWLAARIKENNLHLWYHGIAHEVLDSLPLSRRIQLLPYISTDYYGHEHVKHIVGSDLEVFAALVNDAGLKPLHLVPLQDREFNDIWTAKALMALDAGNSADELYHATISSGWHWQNSESAMYQRVAEGFQSLVRHPDHRLQEIGRRGVDCCMRQRAEALRTERIEELCE